MTLDGKYTENWARDCITFNDSVLDYLARQKSVEIVVLSSPFGGYIDETFFSVLTSQGIQKPSVDFAAEEMEKTNRALRHLGKKIVLFAPPPSSGFNCQFFGFKPPSSDGKRL